MKNIIIFSLFICSVILSAQTVKADIYVNPFYINFGSVKVGQFGWWKDINVVNRGPDATYVSIYNSCGMDMRVSNYCSSYLLSNYSCRIQVEFRPTRPGYQTCYIDIRESAGFGTNVQVTGHGY